MFYITAQSSTTVQPGSALFSVIICPHGLGNCGDNVNSNSGGNTSPLHKQKNITLTILNANNQPVATGQGMVSYNSSSQNFQGTITAANIPGGQYLASVKLDGFLPKQLPGIISIASGQTTNLPSVSLVNGDVNNDNQLDLQDYNHIINCFGSKQSTSSCVIPPTQQSAGSDINDDGKVDGIDYNLFLRELSVQRSSNGSPTPVTTSPVTPPPVTGTVFTYPSLNTKMYTDSSASLLQGNAAGGGIAKTPPSIDFGVAQIDSQLYSTDYGSWGNVVRGPDGKYYFGLGDHSTSTGGSDGALLMDYDPIKKQPEIILFSKDLLGASGEGKWHCRPDINPATGDMYVIGFYNGNLIYYNIYSHVAKDMGKPSPGDGWEEGTWDWDHNRYYGVGNGNINTNSGGNKVLVYDTLNKKTIFSGLPVDSATGQTFHWNNRSRLVDHSTGIFYGSNDDNNHLAKYNPSTNTFSIMKSVLSSSLRAWTNEKEADGSFWIFDKIGNVYKFYPEQDKLQSMGKNWGNGVYTASIARSPDGKYLYYSIADSGQAASAGVPVIQYNTQTNQKKAIAFLSPFYANTHNYASGKIYGQAVNAGGSELFLVSNGNMVSGTRYPGVYNLVIPASERP